MKIIRVKVHCDGTTEMGLQRLHIKGCITVVHREGQNGCATHQCIKEAQNNPSPQKGDTSTSDFNPENLNFPFPVQIICAS